MSDPSPRPTPALPGTQPTEQGATGTSVGQSGQGLPSGTVTFLFTDIEGSTRLAQQFPEDLPALLARHNEIMDRAIEAHRGFVFRTAGDSYSVAFHNAKDALEAALDSQKALQAEAWSPAAIQVRMGIHTGTAQLRPEASDPYSGYATLALTQRIMSAGHGGQVLLSQTVHDLIKDQLPIQARLRDMGECRLKDLLQPHRLYQLECPGLRSEFSPLNTIENTLHNLPTQLTSFIGRENEMRDIKRLIAGNRMVTLTGSGGCGKTRLSIQVASEIQSDFRHGVWLVELAALADPALVAQVITTTLKLREDNQRTSLEVLVDALRTKTILLVLDNCEHVIEACAYLSESLLRSCPGLKILASSREALGIAGEIAYRVPSLKTPNPDLVTSLIELSQLDAIRLFMDRAAVARPGFTMNESNAHFVAQICHRLDGIPLAIELAATRIKMLSPEQVAARLDDRFRLLTGGARTALPRQQTLRAMIDWSYSLLSEKERILFRRLAVFVGGWTLEAAESICADAEPNSATPIPQFEILDLLTHLVDKSLVSIEEAAGAARYNYLETIRQYAREKFFETDEVESIRDRHLAYHARFSEESEKAMQGPGRNAWSRRSEAEQDNLRAAMDWGLVRDPAKATLIASNLVIGITSGGFSIEGFRWLRDSMEKMQTIIASMPPALRARAYIGLSFVHLSLGDNQKSKAFAEQSVSLFRELNDRNSLASALLISSLPREFMGELEEAEAALHEALTLARAVKNAFITAWALNLLARVTARRYGNLDEALHFTDESIRVSKEAGIEFTAANAYEMRGFIAAEKGHYEEALMLYEKAMLAFQEIGASFNVILNKSNIAHLERQFGHDGRALECYRETIQEFRDVGQTGAVAHQLECFGFIAMAHGQDPRAVRLFSAACRLRETADTPMTPDEQIYYDRQLEGLRNRMESSVFGEAWAEGSDFSMDEAITLALEGTL